MRRVGGVLEPIHAWTLGGLAAAAALAGPEYVPAHSDPADEEAGQRPTPRFQRRQRRESIEK
jgi:hypothetical protein